MQRESLGVTVSFFKKNKSKIEKSKQAETADQTRLEKEISEMDRELHLDMRLAELNARLNTPTEEMPSQSPKIHGNEESIGSTGFLSDSLKDFSSPNLSAQLTQKAKSIDVTTPDELIQNSDDNFEELLLSEPTESNSLNITTDKKELLTSEDVVSEAKISTSENPSELPNIEMDTNLAGPSRLDMGSIRLDVAKISADIQSGEEIYRRALQRVEGLMGFVEKAEVDFSVLNRLEPENRRLKAKLRTSNGEIETIKGKLTLIGADLEDHQKRLSEKTSQYEQARSKLVTAANSLQEYDRVLKVKKAESERFALAIERHKTALGVEGRENKVLREKISGLSQALEQRQSEFLEASKMVESLRTDCADFREQAETYRSEAQDLRIALNTAKRQNNAMKGEMQSLHEDIKTFKTQYEFNVINREDQITDLEQQIAFLAKEVDTKSEVVNSTTQDLASLRSIRNEQDIERDRLEKQLAAAHQEIKDITKLAETRDTEKVNSLQAKIGELQTELNRREDISKHVSAETTELQKANEALLIERDSLKSQLSQQRERFEAAVNHNPSNELQAKIDELTEQLRVKDAIVKSAAQDIAAMQRAQEEQSLENKHLEGLVNDKTFQLEAAQKALIESQHTGSELDKKYQDISAALAVNQARRRAESPSSRPDIKPDSSHSISDLSSDDIEDRIMDYKFGIRKDIV